MLFHCQTSDEFDSFITNLEKLVVDISRSNPHFLLLIGDFNAKSSNWSSNDTTTVEGRSERDSINRSIEIFDWFYIFSGKDVHEQVELFNKTLLNIFHNFIPNKIILCDDKDPPWMNDEIKNLIKRKNWLFQCQRKSGNLDYASLSSITQTMSNTVNSSKLKYHERLALNLNDPKTAPKTYWKILKTFVNGTKIPLIPPLLVGNQLVTDFLVKANLFNDYFSQQCTTVDNDSSIPPNIRFATEQKLSTREFCTDDIVKIIKSLD